jgi:hypothetical protein
MSTPLYRTIEFCSSPKALWGKLESGRWDWLGVHPEGKFVLGSPRAPRIDGSAKESHVQSGANELEFSVKIDTPSGSASTDSFPTEVAARYGYEAARERLSGTDTPCIYRLRLVVLRDLVAEEFIVSRPSTYNLPPSGH